MFVNSDFSDLSRPTSANEVGCPVLGGNAMIESAEPRHAKNLAFGRPRDLIGVENLRGQGENQL